MNDRAAIRTLSITGAAVAPVAVAAALVPVRDSVRNANVALVLVGVVVLVAAFAGRVPAAVAAITAAVSFDILHTRPYGTLSIASGADVETTVLLLAIGLGVATLAARGRRARHSATAREGEIRRIYRLASRTARGDAASDVITAAQTELSALLHLESCRFEAPPFASPLDRLERSGVLTWREYHLRDDGFELPPAGVELPVMGRGQLVGRFVLQPSERFGTSLEQRVVAVALADQVGAALAASGERPLRR